MSDDSDREVEDKNDLPQEEEALEAEIGQEDESEEEEDASPVAADRRSGSGRERKQIERLELAGGHTPKEKPQVVSEGRGTKLGEIERVELVLSKVKSGELKLLHRLLFNRLGSANEIKRNIRKFSGFPFHKDDPEFKKKETVLNKMVNKNLKDICGWLDLEKSGNKEEIINRILDFLLEPTPSGKPLPKKKKRGRSSSKPAKKRAKKQKGGGDVVDDADSDSDEEGEDEHSSPPPKKKVAKKASSTPKKPAKSPKKATPKKKAATPSKTKKPAAATKKSAQKKTATKRPAADDSSSDSSDDEPLAKKVKTPPTETEIASTVRGILAGADLEQVTMKSVCKQVYAKYPTFDLTDKKTFIKNTIKDVIS